ncbi:MAG: hypothetical protein AAF772_08510 [Acidobacteriota bacterium]
MSDRKPAPIEPISDPMGVAELLDSWDPIPEQFPDADEGLMSLDDIVL